MENTFLVITSISHQDNPVLREFAIESSIHKVPFILIGDTKSPAEFYLKGCDYYSIERQLKLNFRLSKYLPINHYARKNLGYLVAMSKGADIIVETDDDNSPMDEFWENRTKQRKVHLLTYSGWVNVYKYFTEFNIWPRGFALEKIQENLPDLEDSLFVECPVQQGLADENPDVDAIYRLILPLPVNFDKFEDIALGTNAVCPFNSQNTTWFKEAFPLLYLPSYCSFRMTDIWRSFITQRVAWTCGWPILFHHSTVRQIRNDHDLRKDFNDEVVGYTYNAQIVNSLSKLNLQTGVDNIHENLKCCYRNLIELGIVDKNEMNLLEAWLEDVAYFT